MANLVSDQEMIAILADMAGSVAPALSPIKSPKRQRDTDSPAEIPEPALKQYKPEQTEGMKNIRNRLTSLKPDEPNANSHCKSSENTRETPRVPTACSTDLSHTSGSTENSRPPWTRYVREPTRNY